MPEQPNRQLLSEVFGMGALAERPHLFSNSVVDLPAAELGALAAFVAVVTDLVSAPGYQSLIATRANLNAATLAQQPPGVCLGFDFHRTPDGPKLIEINTNAGGALLVTLLNRAWGLDATADAAEASLLQMFLQEWALWQDADTDTETGTSVARPLSTIAIVDESPEQQYLYPEFVRWQGLFEAVGIHTLICGPDTLHCNAEGRLSHDGQSIDLMYNRLTDFSLSDPALAQIALAWQKQMAGGKTGTLITPHPVAHALWADKRNLDLLSDPQQLAALGLDAARVAGITTCVPRTVLVDAAQSDHFWVSRKTRFFKPQAGFGSRATYRGDKLTKRVFDEILQGGYVAQDFVPPPELPVVDVSTGEVISLKYDLRVYAYDGHIQLLAARLYQGQTTNFRTAGGGFAPVRLVAD